MSILLGPLEATCSLVNNVSCFYGVNRVIVSPPHQMAETPPVPETLFSCYLEFRTVGQSPETQ
jgi:hypothetical protein